MVPGSLGSCTNDDHDHHVTIAISEDEGVHKQAIEDMLNAHAYDLARDDHILRAHNVLKHDLAEEGDHAPHDHKEALLEAANDLMLLCDKINSNWRFEIQSLSSTTSLKLSEK